jgi:DNA helicase IV
MARRKFELPGIHELSKDQERARLLPKEGCHLVVGGPGTGKSVIALLRAKRYHNDNDNDYVFLVYNRLLHTASRELVGGKLSSATWNSWFFSLYRNTFGLPVPMIGDDENSEKKWKETDWRLVLDTINSSELTPNPTPPFLIIDEGQDMPPPFYGSLRKLGFENFFVVADQNQQITDQHSSRQELQDALVLEPEEVIELRDNYRNSFQVACLAREFYPKDPASPCPDLPSSRRSAKSPLLVEYGADCKLTFQQLIVRILKLCDTDPSKLVGIIVPNNHVLKRYCAALGECRIDLDNKRPRIVYYETGSKETYSFSEGGIFVLNSIACKGLEFDTVIIADLHEFKCSPTKEDHIKRLFYVMIARARERVLMTREAGKHCPVESILPQNNDILGRWR